MKLLLTVGTYVAAFLLIAVLAFCLLMALANSPKGAWMEGHGVGAVPFLILSWGAALVLPVFVARIVWRRLSRRGHD